MEIQVDIKPTGIESAIVEAPFDKAKEALESNGYRIISLEENAKLRMQQGKDHYVSQNGNWTREGVLYAPDKRIFLTKNSPIMANVKEATQSNRKGNEYFLTEEQVEQALQDSVKLSKESIPTNRFKENEIANFAFGNVAEDYGLFLKDAGIKDMLVYVVNEDYINKQNKPFARQMWFRDLDYGSILYGRYLDDGNRLRGVKMGAKGVAAEK